MTQRVIDVRHVGGFGLELTFEDGLKTTVDFKERVMAHGGIWEPLRDVNYFKQVRVDPELETIVWPNGVDICPDVLYSLASGKPLEDAAGKAISSQA